MGVGFDLSVDISSFARLEQLAGKEVLLAANLEEALDEAALALASSMKSHMHFTGGYATGELENSIEIRTPAPRERRIGSAVEHAAFVEFGTGRRGAAFAEAHTLPQGYAYGSRPGMSGQPYMEPALDEETPFIEQVLRQAVETTLDNMVY